jgi:nuclear pore complex protein Nup155
MSTTNELLQKSAKLVDQCLTRDKKPIGIEDVARDSYAPQFVEDMFVEKQSVVLPDPIFEQYEKLEYKCFMGVFPEINRAWVTIDNKFFIWSYLYGTDFCEYDELDQVIVSAGLVKPKPNIFKDYVKYLLILATPVEVFLVAVTFNNNQTEINLLPTGYSAPTDSTNMLKITGTSDGRIFMCGQDGNLHELTYEPDDGWLRRKCRKLNHTQSTLRSLLPTFIKHTISHTTSSPIIDVAVDNQLKVIYTLSDDSTIRLFSLGANGDEFEKKVTYTSLIADITRTARLNRDLREFKLKSIYPIEATESQAYQFVAISSKGDRCFFSFRIGREWHVSLGFTRFAPNAIPNTPNRAFSPTHNITRDIHESFYNKGVFLMAQDADVSGNLICVSYQRNSADTQRRQPDILTEIAALHPLSAKPHAIAEVQTSLDPTLVPEGYHLNELATQHVKPPREFICLTFNSILLLTKLRPVDKLQQIFVNEPEDRIDQFIRSYGKDETCCMCVHIACSPHDRYFVSRTTDESQIRNISSRQLVEQATKVFFQYGGQPGFQQEQRIPSAEHEMGGPISQPDISYSHTHNGLYLYFSRLVRPLWSCPLFANKIDENQNIIDISPRFYEDQLADIKTSLYGLADFFNRNVHLHRYDATQQQTGKGLMHKVYGYYQDGMVTGGLVHAKDTDEAIKIQQRSLAGLYELVNRSIGVVEFMEFLLRYKITSLMIKRDPATQRSQLIVPESEVAKLCKLVFRDFVLLPDGEGMMKDLGRFAITYVDNYNALMRDLSNYSMFFKPHDLLEYKALHALHEVENRQIADRETREQSLREILKILLEVAGNVDVESTCSRLNRLHFYTGSAELALTASEQTDASYPERKKECYACALRVLDQLIQPEDPQLRRDRPDLYESPEERRRLRFKVLARMLKSPEEAFHKELYKWFLEKSDYLPELLQMQTPYLENYLREKKNYSLLAMYYDAHGQFDKAAQVMMQAADREDSRLTLDGRIAYLSRAIGHAKAASGKGELLHVLQEKLDVAHVQWKVLQEMMELPNLPHKEIQELNQKLMTVSDLYNKYANPFGLLESSILTLYVADYKDVPLLQSLWKQLIEKCAGVHALETKVKTLGKELQGTAPFFPTEFIISALEQKNSSMNHWTVTVLRGVGMRYGDLYNGYRNVYKVLFLNNDDTEDGAIHLNGTTTTSSYKTAVTTLLQGNEKTRLILVYQMIYILVGWIDYLNSPNAPISEQTSVPLAKIQEHIAEYDSLLNQVSQKDIHVESMKRDLKYLQSQLL